MPKIAEKKKVLDGRGIVGRWDSGWSSGRYFYREIVPGTKKYRYYNLDKATSMVEAESMAPHAAIELAAKEQKHVEQTDKPDDLTLIKREERLLRRKEKLAKLEATGGRTSIKIEDAINDFINIQWKRVAAGVFEQNSYEHKYYCMLHIKEFFEHKGLRTTNQIKANTFDDYLVFRGEATRITQHRELAVLAEWVKSYLVKKKYISSDLYLSGQLIPKVEIRQIDRMANPAINAEDWRKIIDYVRGPYREAADHVDKSYQRSQRVFFRNLFWHYLLVSKGSGMSPEEVLKLKWKNVEVRDVGRISTSKAKSEIEALLDDGIEVMGEEQQPKNAWVQSRTEFGREERLIAYITTIRKKTQAAREIPTNLGSVFRRWMEWRKDFQQAHLMDTVIKGDDLVFGNPFNEGKAVHIQRLRYNWRHVVDGLTARGELKGHKFSDKRYTLYSMRSTFIEDHLIKGTDIFLLARIAGHDIKTLMESYERMDIRKRAEEITKIEYGKKKSEHDVINLLDINPAED